MSSITAPPRTSALPDIRCTLPTRLDGSTVEEVRLLLTVAMSSGRGDLVLDCSEVESIDTVGLGLLFSTHRRAHAGGRRMVIADAQPRVLRVLAVTRLHRVLHLERDQPRS